MLAICCLTVGQSKWKYATGGFAGSSPAISKGVVYVGSADNTIYSFSRQNATQVQTTLLSEVASSPEAASGAVAVGTTLIVASAGMMAQGLQVENSTLNRLRRRSKILDKIITELSQIGSKFNEILTEFLEKLTEILKEFMQLLSKLGFEELEVKILGILERIFSKGVLGKIFSSGGRKQGVLMAFLFKEEKGIEEILFVKEFKNMFIAGVAIFLAFFVTEIRHFNEMDYESVSPIVFLLCLAIFAMIAEIGHDLAIRLSLKSVEGKSVFELSPIGTVITILSGIFGFVVPAAGGTKIFYTFKNYIKDAIVASSGCLFNLIVGILVVLISLYFNSKWFALAGAFPNLALGTFCLFPFNPFEGKRVFIGSKIIWELLFFTSMLLYLYTVFSFE